MTQPEEQKRIWSKVVGKGQAAWATIYDGQRSIAACHPDYLEGMLLLIRSKRAGIPGEPSSETGTGCAAQDQRESAAVNQEAEILGCASTALPAEPQPDSHPTASPVATPRDDLVQQLNGALMNSMGADFEIRADFVREIIAAVDYWKRENAELRRERDEARREVERIKSVEFPARIEKVTAALNEKLIAADRHRARAVEDHIETRKQFEAAKSALAEAPKDAQRLDWMEKVVGRYANIDRISSVNGKFNGLPSLRAAIDAAREGGSDMKGDERA